MKMTYVVYSNIAHFRSRLCLFTADSCSISTSSAVSSPWRLLFFERGQRTTPRHTNGFDHQHKKQDFHSFSVHTAMANYCSQTVLTLLPLLQKTCYLLTEANGVPVNFQQTALTYPKWYSGQK